MKTSTCVFAVLICMAICAQSYTRQREPLAWATELVVVTTPTWNSPQGTLRRYERGSRDKKWKAVGEPIPVMLGKNGLGWGSGIRTLGSQVEQARDPVKDEGDGRAPAGVFSLSKAFGYADQPLPGWKMPYVKLSPSVECVDDLASKFYNQVVDRSTVSPDWKSSEQMLRSDELYRWGVLVDHNSHPAVAGAGSCIFLHIWRGPGQPTVGCTAMQQSDLESLLAWLDPARTPLLVQLPEKQYRKAQKHWPLPALSKHSAASSTMQSGPKSPDKP